MASEQITPASHRQAIMENQFIACLVESQAGTGRIPTPDLGG